MKVSAGFLAAALAVAVGHPVAAATLSAQPANNLPYSPFTIEFMDNNGNGRLDFGEHTSFSGVIFSPGSDVEQVFDTLLGVPDFGNVLSASASPSLGLTPKAWADLGVWRFSGPSGTGDAFPDFWTYQITGLGTPTAVPLPAGLPLLVAALGALALLRRRMRTA